MGNVIVSKYDAYSERILANVEFTIFDEDGNAVQKKRSNQNGLIEFRNLELGTYTLKETGVSDEAYYK